MKFRRYFEIADDRMDMHLHTNWTDGENSIEEMICSAQELNLSAIAFTDHIRKESTYYPNYFQEIGSAGKKISMKVFSGYEAKICDFDGNIDVSKEVSEMADIRIASVHRFPVADSFQCANVFSKDEAQNIEKELSINAIKNNTNLSFNVMGHAGGMSISKFGEFPIEYFDEIIKACSKYDVAFEVNYRYHLKYLGQIEEILCKYNPYVTYGTDAHNQREMYLRKR